MLSKDQQELHQNIPSQDSEQRLYPDLSEMLSNLTANRSPSSSNQIPEKKAKGVDVAAEVFLHLLTLNEKIGKEKQQKIQEFLDQLTTEDLGVILFELYQKELITKKILITSLAKNAGAFPFLQTWWQQQITTLYLSCIGYGAPNTSFDAKQLQTQLNSLLTNNQSEKKLVADLKQDLTEYARKNFYIYKSGNTYYYSPKPAEESIGARCDINGKPLKDEFGEALTDDLGDFRYGLKELRELPSGHFQETCTPVPKNTPGATPLTDINNKSLATKYWEIIKKDKPKTTSKQRAEAINYLFQLIDTASAEEIFKYMSTSNFQALTGEDKITVTFWKLHLADICRKFVAGYTQLSTQSKDEVLVNILLDFKIFYSLSYEKLAFLFWHYNPFLVANVIVKLYEEKEFRHDDLDFGLLEGLLKDEAKAIETINVKRCSLKSKLILPPDSRLPGKNHLEDERLTKHQLFQYDDKTIAAVEQWLRTEHSNLIISNDGEIHLEKLDKSAPYYFYQIPAGSYMLIDPAKNNDVHYYRYQQFKNDLPQLIHDKNVEVFGKPVIFFGIINIDGNHYLPYFIYKNKSDKVYVITVDPSPHLYPENARDHAHSDTKIETFHKAQRIFQDVFPGCQFNDPQITQMLRERDCGPISAQTNTDALTRTLTSWPLLVIDENDQLQINATSLCLQGEPQGINPYTGTFVYPSYIETKANSNRFTWQERLSHIDHIVLYARPDELFGQPLSVTDQYVAIDENYSYAQQVERQTSHDERNTNISAIQSLLLADEVGRKLVARLIENYKKTLMITDINEIADFIKGKVDHIQLQHYISAHEKNIDLLLEDVASVILKDHIPQALESTLEAQVLSKLPNRTDLNADKIIQDFLEKNRSVFKKLSPYEQLNINEALRKKTESAVKKRLIELHSKIMMSVLQHNCHNYLLAIPGQFYINTIDDLTDIVLSQIDRNIALFKINNAESKYKPEHIEHSLLFLRGNAPELLKDIFQTQIKNITNLVFVATLPEARKKLNLAGASLNDLLKFFHPSESKYLTPSITRYLSDVNQDPMVLTLSQFSTAVGLWLIPKIEQMFLMDVSNLLAEKINNAISALLNQTNFSKDYTAQSLSELDSWLDDFNRLTTQLDFSDSIERHGTDQTLSVSNYRHTVSSPLINFELQKVVESLVLKERDKQFYDIAYKVLDANKEKLIVNQLNKHFAVKGPTAMELFHYATTSGQDEIVHLFDANFIIKTQYQNIFYTRTGNRFTAFVETTFAKPMAANYLQAMKVQNEFLNVMAIITELKSLNSKPINQYIEKYELKFSEGLHRIENLHVFDRFSESLAEIKNDFIRAVSALLSEIISKLYANGEVTPGALTTVIRPTLCKLCGVDTTPILTSPAAGELDKKLLDTLQNLDTSLSKSDCSLLIMKEVKELPDTYNKPITRELLIDLVSFWYGHRSMLTDIKNIFDKDSKDGLPSIIQILIGILNEMTSDAQLEMALPGLKRILAQDPKEQLLIFNATDITSLVTAALLKTSDIMGDEFGKTTPFTFGGLLALLHGKNLPQTPKNIKPVVSLEEFNKIVIEEYKTRAQISVEEVFIDEIRIALLTRYSVQGMEQKPILSKEEFEKEVLQELRRKNKQALQDAQKANVKPKLSNLTDVRKELSEKYAVESKEEEHDEVQQQLNTTILPKEQLQDKSIFSFFKGSSGLTKMLKRLQARHSSNDTLDEWDLAQLTYQLKQRWDKLLRKEGHLAVNHYLSESRSASDNQCIELANKLAQYYRMQGKVSYMYHLLMPNLFPAPARLTVHHLPASIVTQINSMPENGKEEIQSNSSNNLTIDDIPLQDLIITRTGYAFDINWLIQEYIKNQKLINLYTGQELTFAEAEDLLANPKSQKLLDQLRVTRLPHMSPRAIDILEKYVINSTFQVGISQYYDEGQNDLASTAYQVFRDELNALPKREKHALLQETIPNNAYSHTVEIILKNSSEGKNCMTHQNMQLARVVIAYKPNNNLPKFIYEYMGPSAARITQRPFGSVGNDIIEATKLELHLLKLAAESTNKVSIKR